MNITSKRRQTIHNNHRQSTCAKTCIMTKHIMWPLHKAHVKYTRLILRVVLTSKHCSCLINDFMYNIRKTGKTLCNAKKSKPKHLLLFFIERSSKQAQHGAKGVNFSFIHWLCWIQHSKLLSPLITCIKAFTFGNYVCENIS